MKKRLISIVLTICMVACLFSGLSVTAHADNVETTEYTLKAGDNVYTVCQKLGIDFKANYDWITKTNNITNYSSLAVGKKIILPLSDTSGITAGTTTGSTGTVSGTVNTASKLLEGDKIVSYLIPHVVAYGETMYDLCVKYGIDYNKNIDYLLKLNNLKNANRIAVGRTLLFPSTEAPASGACFAIVSHKVVAGDATYNLCNSYGIDFEDNLELMKVINNKSNMASIKTGQQLLIPVPATVTAVSGNTGNAGNAGNTGNTGNAGNSGNTGNTGSTESATSYKITKKTPNALYGSYTVLVNNSYASEAKAGDTVTVNVTANEGHKLDKLKVLDSTGKSVSLNATTFTMPASDVSIEAIFVSSVEYHINDKAAKNGTYSVKVNGSVVNNAAEGQTVVVETQPNYGYELRKIEVVNKKGESVPVSNKSFTMPNSDVTVTVTFGEAYNHNINVSRQTADGTVKVKLNGNAVSKAKAGETVTVEVTPNDGYELDTLKVAPVSGNDTITVTNNSFVMPEYDVNVIVSFKAQDFNIKSAATSNGTFTVVDGYDKVISSADTAAAVYVKPEPAAGYVVDKVSYTSVNGDVTVEKTGDVYYFAMPTSDITVNVTFKARVFYLAAHTDSPAVTFTVNGKDANGRAYMGETVVVDPHTANGVMAKEIKVLSTSNLAASTPKEVEVKNVNITKNANGTFSFTMPSTNVTVKAIYALEDVALNKANATNGSFSFKKTDANGDAITTAHMGDTVYVATAPNDGYHTSKIVVTYADGKTEDITASQTFTMPGKAVSVAVTFTGNSNKLSIVNSTPSLGSTILELKDTAGEIGSARTGETVKIVNTPVKGYKVASVSVVDANGKTVSVKSNCFVMPASAVTVTVSYTK